MALKLSYVVSELKRRKVTRAAVGYVIAGIAFVEGADIIGTPLGLPPEFLQSAALLFVAGFPVAMLLAWVLDISAGGVRWTAPLQPRQQEAKATGWWTPGRVVLVETTLVIVLAGAYFTFGAGPTSYEDEDRVAIAVLPFANLSGDVETEVLSDGVHDDVITQLAKIHALRVTSHTSVQEYRDTDKSIREIGEELGVSAILEGGVQRDRDRIRINAQLIDAATDEHLWAETYDRQYSVGNLFAIQSDLAEKISVALNATLRPVEARRIAAVPTQDTVAYGLYLRARELYARGRAEHEIAMELFRQAIRLDPDFAPAYTRLSLAHYQRVQYYGHSVEEADTAIALAQKGVQLAPEQSIGHQALAWAYELVRRHEDARQEFLRAIELDPSAADPLNGLGLQARNQGRHDEAYEWLVHAISVDPRTSAQMVNAGGIAMHLGMYDQSARWLSAAEAVAKTPHFTTVNRVMLELAEGRFDDAKRRADAFSELQPTSLYALLARGAVAFYSRDVETTRAVTEQFLERAPNWGLEAYPATIRTICAWSLRKQGETERADRLLDEAGAWLDEAVSRFGPQLDLQVEFAALAALRGDHDKALRRLELASGASLTGGVAFLRMDARFDGLAADPRFADHLRHLESEVATMRERVERGTVELRER